MNNTLSFFHHSSINKYFICFILFLLCTGFVQEQAYATANYVYHERSTNNPGCGGQFVSNLTPGSADAVTLRFKVEYQYYTDNARLYYTTDGTNPSGAYGTPSGTTQVVTANWVCLFNAGQNVDVWEAAIPAQQGGKTVKYIISAWHSGGGSEIFANSGEFANPFTTSAQATQFSYTVTCPTITVSPTSLSSGTVGSSYNQSVTASGGTSSYTYAVTTGTLPAGLTLASNGTLSGTPTTSGTSNFTITATDANGCTGSQAYSVYVFPSIPTITSFTPTTGVSETSVTITGTNFDATASNNVVYFGGVQASVTAASSTSLTVLSPLGAMYAPITVTVNGKTAMSRARFNPTFTPSGTLNTATFSSPVSFATSMATYNYPAVGDIDGDGKLDVLQISNSGGKFMVFRNTSTAGTISSGSFDAEVAVSTGSSPRSIHVADIDGDGKLDAVVICGAYAASLTIHRNTSTPGSISFSSGVSHYAGGSISGGCGIGDLNADGKPDIAYADGSNSVYIYTNSSTPGTIAMTYATAVSNLYAPDIAITDVDGDGKHDLILAHSSNDTVYVYRNTVTSQTLSFDSPVRLYGKGAYLAVGDVDGDGLSDIITSGWSGKFGILQNTSTSGNISFSARTTFTAETYPNYPHLGDLTGDGKPDVFTPGWGTNNLAIYPNTSSSGVINGSSLGSRVMYSGGVDYNVNSGGLADFDGDGRFDILALKDNSFVIMRNQLGNTYTISANAVGGGTVSPSGVTNVSHYANQAYSITANANYRIDSVVTDGTNRGSISSYTFTNVIANHTITAYFSYVCPTITVSPSTLSNGTAGSPYSETITASGGTSPYTYAVSTGTLPSGLGLSSGGVLSGTPSGAGTSNFTVTATDANGCTGSLAYALTVSVACDTGATLDQQQLVTSSGSLAIQAGQTVAQTFTAGLSGTLQRIALYLGKQDGYDYTTSSTITAGDLVIEMQSTVSSTTNSFGGNCGTITRNAPSGTVLATMTVPNSSVALGGGQFYTFDFPTPISLTSGEIYAIVVRNTGIQPVDGNPGRFDWYDGRLNGGITDPYIGGASLAKQTAASTWSIFEAVQPNSCNFTVYDDMAFKTYIGMGISLSPGSLSNGTVGSAYSQMITASNGASPYTFAVTSGSLPAGLTLSNAGELSGTPTAAGTSNFTVTATDANGCTGNKSYSLAINCPTITINPSILPSGVAGSSYSETITGSGGANPYTFVVSTGSIPAGLTLSAGGVLSGTPSTIGTSNFSVMATDANGCTGVGTFTINVVDSCAQTLDQQQTEDGGGSYSGIQSGYKLAQTFTPSLSGILKKFELKLDNQGGGDLIVELQSTVSGSAPSFGGSCGNLTRNLPTGTVLATMTIPSSSIPASPSQFYQFEFPTPATLTGGVTYAFVLYQNGGGYYRWFQMGGSSTDSYTGGLALTLQDGNPTWNINEAVQPNSCNFTAYRDMTFKTYVGGCSPPPCLTITVTPPTLPNGTTGLSYSQNIVANGGAVPYSFAVTGGALPSGLTLSTTGSLSGTPSTVGESNFTVTATDSNGCTGIQSYTLIVEAPRSGSISGMKWNDADGDGVKDAEEQGIQNWNIYLTGAKIDSTLTDGSGNYTFNGLSAGEYTVREESREGWTQTYPESVTHIVVLTAGEDANQKNFGNKVTEETTPPFTYTTPEILDGQDEFCTPLIMNRNYTASETWFVKAKGGDLGVTLYAHAVNNVDPESVFVQVFNSSSTLVTEFGVGYTAGEVSSAGIGFEKSIMVNIGARTPGEILRFVVTTPSPTPATQPHYRFHFGRVVSAALNSPSFPGFEEEYARWYVNVLPSEDLDLDFFTTDMPTPADTMVVRVVDPSGAYHASSGMYTVGGTTEINVPGASSGVWSVEVEHTNGHYRVNKTTGTDRGIYVGQFSGGCGEKIVNITQNGSPSIGLPVGITINRQVATPAGLQYVAKDSVFTDSSSFTFGKLPSGFYKIDVRPMSPGYITPAAQYDTVICDSVLVNTFNFESSTGTITGMKFEDTNGNGVKDENEHGIPNWEIFLNGEAFMASTDTNGHYEFNNLVAGTYIVSEVSVEGWIQTLPGDPGTYTVELTPGATISGKNFGNKRDCSIACAPDTTLYMPSNGCTVSGVTLTPPSIDGICEIISSTNNAPTDFSLGTTTVEWTVTVAGGAVYTCNQIVTVLDTIKPTVVCSPNLNVSADENQCGANVNFTFGATDNCPGVMTTASHTSGSFFGLGTTTVTVIAADSAGNSDTCSFTVTVTDTHPPVVICPANMNVYATSEAGAVVNFSVSGLDNCPGVMTSTNPPSGSLFPFGATTVISIATDSSGNADTCSFTINVLAAPAMISGMKYEDADGDGVKDAGEVGLQGWVISLTGSATALDTTDGSGNYSFANLAAGTYTVREVVKSGWVQTTANPADITLAMGDTVSGVNFGNFHFPVISGMKFNDLNGNGVKDNGESGLANWIIKATKGVTTKIDTTDVNGEYSFSFTIAQLGTWVISEELQSGWAQTFPAGGTYSIALVSGTNSTNTDFGNQQFSSISGSKYDDFDGDSVTSGDAKLSGWVIKLFKNNAIVSRTTTNGSGDYTFTNLTPGTYVVQESLRVGWIQTYPSVSNSVPAVDDVNEGPRAYSVTITSGSVITGKDFANFKLGTLSGVKFLDYNGDSLKNAGELGLEQWEIVLTKGETAFDTAYTDAQGNYQFTNLLAANYTVSETGREGWYQTTPASGSYIITVSSGTTETSLNFGNFEYGSISGVKFFDRDSSGTKDPTCETILPGTKIVLVGPHATADTLTTDANGEFTFTNVPAGVFTLKEGNNPNWNQTYPANGASYSITMVSGLDSAGLTFGNFYMPDTLKFRTFILSDYAKSSRAAKKSGFISNPTAGNVRDTVFIKRGFGLDNQNDSGYLRIGIRRPDSSLVYGWFFHRWSIYKGPAVKHWIYNTKAWGLKRNPKTKTYVQRNPAFYLGIVGEQITETYFGNAGNHLTMELTTLKTNIAASDLGITPRGLGDLLFVCRDNTADSVFNGMTVRKIVSIADTMLTMGRKIVNVSASQIDTTYRCDVPYLALLDSTLARINNEFRSTATKIDTISTKPLKLKGVKGLYKVSYLMRDSIAPIPLAHFDPVYASSNGEPEEFKLEQNYPNPFNPTTTLSFVISNQSLVTLKIYNLLGQEVATLFDKQDMEAGMQEVEFNGANLASGVYFYRLTATSAETGTVNTDVKRMIMIK